MFRLLCAYFDNDRGKVLAELVPLLAEGHNLATACEKVIASHGFERAFY